MKIFIKLAVALAAAGGALLPAQGRMQPPMFCWSPDVEFPVACEEEEDEDEGNKLALLSTRPARHGFVPYAIPSLIEDQR
jgi:hypothetical protein